MRKKYYRKKSNNITRNIVYTSLIIICLVYYFYNYANENSLLDFISESLIVQTVVLFGTMLTFLTLFLRLDFQKKLSNKEIIDIWEEKKNKDEELVEIIKKANIG